MGFPRVKEAKRVATLFFLVILSSCCYFSQSNAQHAVKWQVPILTQNPANMSGIRLDVKRGYMIGDSIEHTVNDSDHHLVHGFSDRDTLHEMFRYLYRMKDNDPILFYAWSIQGLPYGTYYQTPQWELNSLKARSYILTRNLDSGWATALSFADYILDVQVEDTASHYDTRSRLASHVIAVSARVIDTIKGRHYLSCTDAHSLPASDSRGPVLGHTASSQVDVGDGCLQFEYRPGILRIGAGKHGSPRDSNTVMPDGSPWIKKGMRYIVLLQLERIYEDDTALRSVFLSPIGSPTTCAGMYPVIDGIVWDPHNDLGFGTGIRVEDWKRALRSRIAAMLRE
jgi:hypothetical protein